MEQITTEEQLRALLGDPVPAALAKERTALTDLDREWLAASPFCLIATSGADGSCDVSPKGDPPPFTLVLDDRTVAVPERADTLRINGRARLVTEPALLDRMVVKGHRPVLAVVVEIEQVFHHCGKAFLRSQLWDPESWAPDAVPSRARIAHALERRHEPLEDLERYYSPETYAAGLYPTA